MQDVLEVIPLQNCLDTAFIKEKVCCCNRQLHKCTVGEGGYCKRNQAECIVKGFCLFDKVSHQSKEYFIFDRQKQGILI